ncbi:MAG: hypothetical protein C0502_01420 [Opitutus sp.]|nr:hypothetical protein [Opitutus sp.]
MKPQPRPLPSPRSIWPLWVILIASAVASFAAPPREEASAILQQATADENDPAKLAEAMQQLDALAARADEDAGVHFARGWLLSRLKRSSEAIAAYRTALARDPNFPEARYNLGVQLVDAGDRESALREFEEAIRLDPTHTDALYNAGQANYDLERYGAALAKWRALQKLTPDNFQVARKILQSLNALGLAEEAALARDEAIRLWRENRDPAAAQLTQFCFDQIPLPPNRVFAYELFEPAADGTLWKLLVSDANGRTRHVIRFAATDAGGFALTPPEGAGLEPRAFAERPAWREVRPIVRDWAKQLLAAPPPAK